MAPQAPLSLVLTRCFHALLLCGDQIFFMLVFRRLARAGDLGNRDTIAGICLGSKCRLKLRFWLKSQDASPNNKLHQRMSVGARAAEGRYSGPPAISSDWRRL